MVRIDGAAAGHALNLDGPPQDGVDRGLRVACLRAVNVLLSVTLPVVTLPRRFWSALVKLGAGGLRYIAKIGPGMPHPQENLSQVLRALS